MIQQLLRSSYNNAVAKRTRSGGAAQAHRDEGMALPMVMVLIVVIAASVIALATYTITDLRYSRITEERSDRLSAADAGMRYAIDQLKLRNAGCILDTQEAILPGVQADFNSASAAVTCERITSGFEGIQAYAAVMTGEGLDPDEALLKSQSGSNSKVLGGPVYMSRVDQDAFSLGPPVEIADGPLLYHDTTGNTPCTSVKSSTIPSQLVFEPELIFGPVCVSVPWTDIFDSPDVPDLTGLVERDGLTALSSPGGSYTDFAGGGGCRVFEPGYYTSPPDTKNIDAYFKTGDYLFEFNAEWEIRKSITTAGKVHPLATPSLTNELSPSNQCLAQQAADPAPGGEYGATFYLAGNARINVATQGSVEVHARLQGATDYVSVQALCAPNGDWCNADGGGSFAVPKASALAAPAASSTDNVIFTDSGNNKEFVAHALVYAPLAQMEFGNVTNTATQKMLGGMIVSRLVLQSSTSATNFEISVPTSPITAEIRLTSTAVKNGETAIQAVVQYRPYEGFIDDRVRVNSWRVCNGGDCTPSAFVPSCSGGDAVWTADFYNNQDLLGVIDYTETTPGGLLAYDWGNGSPHGTIGANGFSARFTRSIDLPGPGTYRFEVGSDDGQRLYVDGNLELDSWIVAPIGSNINTVDVVIPNACGVLVELEYFENTGQAEVFLNWTKL